MTELFIGLMSGTSMDGVDAALMDLEDTPSLVDAHSHPIPAALQERLAALYGPAAPGLHEAMELDVQLGYLFAQAANTLLTQSRTPRDRIRAVGSHGQTIYHRPGGHFPVSLQIGDPNVIAEQTGLATVADFRRGDLAAGGQGAPFAPVFHEVMFRSTQEDRLVLNIGGIANVTLLPGDGESRITGFDTGPGNTLMDAWARRHLGRSMDDRGQWAAGGQVHQALLQALLDDAYFQSPPPKSTGREMFNLQWLDGALAGISPAPSTVDVQATLCELTAATICEAIGRFAPSCQRILVCGGGAHNTALMHRLGALLAPRPVQTTSDYGLGPDWVEAATFAWLAKQALEGNAVDLRSVTGSSHPAMLGGIYRAARGQAALA